MNFAKSAQLQTKTIGQFSLSIIFSLLLVGCGDSATTSENQPPPSSIRTAAVGSDQNSVANPLLSLNAQGPGGSPNQSLRSGDVFQGGASNDVLIGGLGVDVMLGGNGDDVLIGGTEDFNSSVDGDDNGSDNRDRAFGGNGNDTFIWAPGDGSDFFDGGPGIDVVIFGVLGEERDSDGSTDGAPFFNVNPPGTAGSSDFDGIFLDAETKLPTVSASNSPGFCTVLDQATNPVEMAALSLDQLIRFSLRGIANAFDAGSRTDDDGLRVALSIRNTEFVVCTKREVVDGGGDNNIEVLNISTYPPTSATLADLPESVRQMIQ